MRARPTLILGILCALALTQAAHADNGVAYYVSLGDSLASGSQPTVSNSDQTGQGYADQLYTIMRSANPKLRLAKLGCGGESTTSMINGGSPDWPSCNRLVYKSRYPHGTQLAEAVSFLHAHRSHLALVTIDIGGDDLLGGGLPAVRANLPVILQALRDAAGPDVPIVGMTYYDPFLAEIWFTTFDLAALQAEANLDDFNGTLENIYGSFGDPVAQVDDAFSNTDTTIQPDGLPLDVDRLCEWTWLCTASDLHPNATGYRVIAQAFLTTLSPT
jgi:lysophospholipase L1-like esterase